MEVVTATSASNSTTPKTASAACPSGKTAISGGAQVLGGLIQTVLRESRRPSSTEW